MARWLRRLLEHLGRGILVGGAEGAVLAFVEVTVAQGRPIDLNTDWDVFLMAIVVEAALGGLVGGAVGGLVCFGAALVGRLRRQPIPGASWRAYIIGGAVTLPLVGAALYEASVRLGAATPVDPLLLGAGVVGCAVFGGWLVNQVFRLAARLGTPLRSPRRTSSDVQRPTRQPPRVPSWLLTRRGFLSASAGATALAALAAFDSQSGRTSLATTLSPGTPSALNRADVPNLIVITIDTLRADYVHCYGNPTMQTPTIDRLAAEGVRFARAIVQQPNTNASHASIFTGLYPKTHGVRLHMQDRLSPQIPTMAKILKEHGYNTTGLFSWVSFEPAFSGLDQGFDEYQGFVTNRPITLSDPRLEYLAATYRRLVDHLSVLRTSEAMLNLRGDVEEEIDGRADITTEAALEWLDRRKAGPFFLWLHYYDPHYPYTPPPPFNTMYYPDYKGAIKGGWETIDMMRAGAPFSDSDVKQVRALYSGEISFADQQLGRFIDALRSRDLLDRSVVVLSGDHGESLADDGYWLHPAALYYTETRVPFILRYPARLPAGAQVASPVQEIDILPTVLDLLGIKPSNVMEGSSLLTAINAVPTLRQSTAFSALPPDEDDESLIQTNDWAYILNRTQGTRQLYDLTQDPDQRADVAKSRPEVADQLEGQLVSWLTSRTPLTS
jgi:arylsulfatase A-like enzyme